jgi:hypothetical protein
VLLLIVISVPFFISSSLQIIFENRFRNDRGRTCNITMDGTDCVMLEPWPWESSFSWQFNFSRSFDWLQGNATDGWQYNAVQVRLGNIFRIMQDSLLVERQYMDVAAVEAAEGSVTSAERLMQIE